jgi:hypothetical protein
MGVTITRSAMLSHCRALTAACSYTEGEVVVCVLDFKVCGIDRMKMEIEPCHEFPFLFFVLFFFLLFRGK